MRIPPDQLRNADQRKKLAKIGTTYGMVKGPFSHQSIGCKAMRVGFCNNFEDEWWAAQMTSDCDTVDMIIDRICNDWKELPTGLRKTADEQSIQNMQKVCRCFQLMLHDLQSKLPAATFAVERKKLEHAFSMGTLDASLKQECENQSGPLDCSRFSECKLILESQKADVILAAAQKRKELAKSLETATFMSLSEELKVDTEKVAAYIQELGKARGNWQVAVAAYKRTRRSKGLKACHDFMKTNIDVDKLECDENLADMSKHFNVFRAAVGADASSPQ